MGNANINASYPETPVSTYIDVQSEMTKMLANRANIGYTTGGHTGEDFFVSNEVFNLSK